MGDGSGNPLGVETKMALIFVSSCVLYLCKIFSRFFMLLSLLSFVTRYALFSQESRGSR